MNHSYKVDLKALTHSILSKDYNAEEHKVTLPQVILARKYHSESGPVCRIYLCTARSADDTGYCQDHVSPLRTGKAPYTPGSAPVVRKKAA